MTSDVIVASFFLLFVFPGSWASTDTGNASVEVIPMRDVEDQVSAGLIPIYRMTNCFLNDVIQTPLLTSMPPEFTASVEAYSESWADHWDDWLIQYIGFVVCASIGIVGFFTVILAALIFPCCRCCGRCGSKDPEYRKQKRKSRCCIRACEVAMAVVTVTLILAHLPLYGTNEKFYPQFKVGVFEDVSSSMGEIDQFMRTIPDEINTTVFVGFVQLEATLFRTLDAIPADAMTAIDNATGVVTSLTELSTFSDNSLSLNTTMIDAIQLAETLDQQTVALWNNFTAINTTMASKLNPCTSSSCASLLGLMAAAHVAVNFTAVPDTLTQPQRIIELAIQLGLIDLVNSSMSQLNEINNTIIDSTDDSTQEIKTQCKDAEQQLEEVMIELNDTVGSVDIADIQEQVLSYQEYVELPADITYYVIIGLSIVMSIIITSNVVGLTLGILLPPCRRQPSATGSKRRVRCARDKSLASHFLLFSVALTFIFYWFYLLLVMVLFVAGGLVETEVCRHVINFENNRSAGVLAIFDSWANESLYETTELEVLPFNIYSECSNNAAVYTAMNLGQKWNLTELTNTEELDKAIADLKATEVLLPVVNFTNNDLNTILFGLEDALNRNVLNITKLIDDVSGSIIVPDLREIRDAADAVTDVNLSTEVAALNALIDSSLNDVETDRDVLVDKLLDIQSYIGNINFTTIALTLDSGQQELNANGSEIVGQFINETADVIYIDVTQYSEQTVDAVENDVAQCGDLYDSVTKIVDSTCVAMIYPMNGFWFSLGWCLAFLVPSLVLAVHLETVYRYTQTANSVSHSDDVDSPTSDVITQSVTDAEDQPKMEPTGEKSETPKESTSVPPPDYL